MKPMGMQKRYHGLTMWICGEEGQALSEYAIVFLVLAVLVVSAISSVGESSFGIVQNALDAVSKILGGH